MLLCTNKRQTHRKEEVNENWVTNVILRISAFIPFFIMVVGLTVSLTEAWGYCLILDPNFVDLQV